MRPSRFCAYCGAAGPMTADHVPPRSLFPKPRPELITVPACAACHSPTSIDDEYFLHRLCLSSQGGDHPAAKSNVERIFRSLQRPQAPGLRQTLVNDTITVQMMSPGGVYLGPSTAFNVDLERIFRVIARTVRGLFFEETERQLHSDYDVRVHSNDTLSTQDPELLEEFNRTILVPLSKRPVRVIGDEVFMYRYAIAEEDPNLSAWALTFYRNVPFLAITGPKVDPRTKPRGEANDG